MTLCIAPHCNFSGNSDRDRYCQNCGRPLLLKLRYRPLRLLGQGGFGRTFVARDMDIPSQPFCVIKQLCQTPNERFNQQALRLFRQEAIRLEKLGEHPQIPKLLAHFEDQDDHYLIQEYVEGDNLGDEVHHAGPFQERQIWQVLGDLATVLTYIHQQNIIHRDLKPTNIMRRRADGKLILIDFGIAKLLSQTSLNRTLTMVGSPEYMAPEQTRGHIAPASDLYSLGMTCVYLLTLKAPLSFYSPADDTWFWREGLPPGRGVSDRLAETLDRLLQTPISRRFSSAKALGMAVYTYRDAPRSTAAVSPALSLPPIQSDPDNWGEYLTTVDYRPLKDLLQAHRWQEADILTWESLAQSLGKSGRFVSLHDIGRIPCGDLERVDILWRKYSGNHFGLSIQAEIFAQAGDYGQFCQQVGWKMSYQGIHSLNFTLDAPRGHLPSSQWISGSDWWKHQQRMSDRLTACKITS